MTLSVTDPEAERPAYAIAQETGESISGAGTEALRQRYQGLRGQERKASVEELLDIAKRIDIHVKGPHVDHAEFLYNERGLPK